jgi:hypothetical protein
MDPTWVENPCQGIKGGSTRRFHPMLPHIFSYLSSFSRLLQTNYMTQTVQYRLGRWSQISLSHSLCACFPLLSEFGGLTGTSVIRYRNYYVLELLLARTSSVLGVRIQIYQLIFESYRKQSLVEPWRPPIRMSASETLSLQFVQLWLL